MKVHNQLIIKMYLAMHVNLILILILICILHKLLARWYSNGDDFNMVASNI